jgi:hypothetical protein
MNELVTLRKIEQSKLAISEVKTLGEIKQIIDQGEALKAYVQSAKLSAELQAEVSELSARAKRKLGEISAKLEKKAGKRTDLFRDNEEVTKEKALSNIGVTPQYANEAEKLAKIPEKIFEKKLPMQKRQRKKSQMRFLRTLPTNRANQNQPGSKTNRLHGISSFKAAYHTQMKIKMLPMCLNQ